MTTFTVVAVMMVMCVAIVFLLCMTKGGLFSPRWWRYGRAVRAIDEKSFKGSLESYGYKILHSDKYGTVWEYPDATWPGLLEWAEEMAGARARTRIRARRRILEVIDSTTKERYFLGLPWEEATSTGKGAVAWTFDIPVDQYNPVKET